MSKRSSKNLKGVLSGSIYFLIILIIVLLVVTFVGQRVKVIGSSMSPTLEDADGILVDKLTYRLSDPERFDIVVFPYKYEKRTYFVKRVIGLPGETVQILADGTILIDGEELVEYYGKETIKNPGVASNPVTLGDDEYFVMGDNRNNSKDSRFEDVGNIKRKELMGKAWIRIYPFNEFGKVE